MGELKKTPTTRPGLRSVVVSWWFLLYLVFHTCFSLLLFYSCFISCFIFIVYCSLTTYTHTPSRATVITSYWWPCSNIRNLRKQLLFIRTWCHVILGVFHVIPLPGYRSPSCTCTTSSSMRAPSCACFVLPLEQTWEGIEPLTNQREALGS